MSPLGGQNTRRRASVVKKNERLFAKFEYAGSPTYIPKALFVAIMEAANNETIEIVEWPEAKKNRVKK